MNSQTTGSSGFLILGPAVPATRSLPHRTAAGTRRGRSGAFHYPFGTRGGPANGPDGRSRPIWRIVSLLCIALFAVLVQAQTPAAPAEDCFGALSVGRVLEWPDSELRVAVAGEKVRARLEYAVPSGARRQGRANRRILDLSGVRDARGEFPLTVDGPEDEPNQTQRAPRMIPTGDRGGSLTGLVTGRTLHYTLTPAGQSSDPQFPAYRLRCEPRPQGQEGRSVVLLILGESPMTLDGIEDNSRLAIGDFNPASVSVRRLAGDPALYLIRYDDGYGWGRGETEGRHHLVTRVGDTGHRLVDEWTTSDYGMGNGSFSGSDEGLEISRRGATLRLVKRRLAVEEFDGEGFEPGDPGAGEVWEDHAVEVRMRELDIRTGAVLTERSRRPAGRRLLLADDGTAGWLRLTAEPLPQRDLPGRFDPRKRPELDALSLSAAFLPDPRRYLEAKSTDACWLYNRRDRETADAGRAEGPLPGARLRLGWGNHSDPSNWGWSFPTSADGRWTSLYRGEHQLPDPTALRAVFDATTHRCYSAGLLADGPYGPYGRALLQPVRPHLRITLASEIRRRSAPGPAANELVYSRPGDAESRPERLAIGTPLLVLGRSAIASRLDDREDRWYWVAGPDGINGWVFGGLLEPYDPARPEPAWRRVIERYLATDDHGPTDAEPFNAFLAGLAPDLSAEQVAAMDPRALLARRAQQYERCRRPDGEAGESVRPATGRYLTLAIGVMVRPAPVVGCGLLGRLAIGTPVKLTGRTPAPVQVGTDTDHWYRVEAPGGLTGWVFGALLSPDEPARPALAWRAILERQHRHPPADLQSAAEWLDWLGPLAPRLPPDLLPDLELARLNALAAVALPERRGLAALGAPSVAPYLVALATYIDASGYRLDLGRAYRDWSDRHPGHPAAESAAWGETRLQRPVAITTTEWSESAVADAGAVPAFRDIGGDLVFRYLARYPQGAHAAEAHEQAEARLAALDHLLDRDRETNAERTRLFYCQADLRASLEAIQTALAPLTDEHAAALRARLAAILARSCTPQIEAAAPPLAKTPAPAAPCKLEIPDGVSLAPAAGSLACQAEQQRQAGDSAGAAATLERALRIAPLEAYLWNRLARVRLEQGLAVQAGQLAARSNDYVGSQTAIEQGNWRIIAEAKRRAGDAAGASEAEQRAGGD